MIIALANLSWLPVVLAALVYYLLGAAWFTPLFGKAWDRAIGHVRSRESRLRLGYYLVPLIRATLVSLAVGLVIAAVAPDSLGEAALIGLIIGAFGN